MATEMIDSLDEQILRLIADNARIPYLEVARMCGVSGAAVHQRVQKLIQNGIITGAHFLLDPVLLGYETCAFVGIFLRDPQDFDRVCAELAKMPEVVEVHYTTGNYDLFIKIYSRNNTSLMHFIHDKLQTLGIQRTETIISFHEALNRRVTLPEHIKEGGKKKQNK